MYSLTFCVRFLLPERHIQSTGLLQCTAVWRVGKADASSTISPARTLRATSDRRAAPRPHYADLTTAPLAAHTSTSPFQDRRPGLSMSDRPGTSVSGRRLSAYFRRQYAPTPIDRHSDLRRPAYKQQFRRPVFCGCRTTSGEHVANPSTAL